MKVCNLKNLLFVSIAIYINIITVYANETSTSKYSIPHEIASLFGPDREQHVVHNSSLPLDKNKIFAEGGSSVVNPNHVKSKTETDLINKASNTKNLQQSTKSLNVTEKIGNRENGSIKIDSKLMSQKLNETTLEFISSDDEVIHAKGTSSVKPRKGVSYSKIVPKKGVSIEDFLNYSLPSNHSCFVFNQSICYDVDYYQNLECKCCNISNKLGKVIERQPLTNCNSCLSINVMPNISLPCLGVCCENSSQIFTVKSISSNIDSNNSNKSKVNQIFETGKNNAKLLNKLEEKMPVKQVKLKPAVTKVPYDSDTNPFNKSKGEKYVPIVVSIFILPLVGIFLFFMWKKTRELWDRRYYKRMDFLIDGMYNE